MMIYDYSEEGGKLPRAPPPTKSKRRSKRGMSLTGFLRSKELLASDKRRIKLKSNVHSDAALELRASGRLTSEDIEAIYMAKPPDRRSSAATAAAAAPAHVDAGAVTGTVGAETHRRTLRRPRSASARLRTAGGTEGAFKHKKAAGEQARSNEAKAEGKGVSRAMTYRRRPRPFRMSNF